MFLHPLLDELLLLVLCFSSKLWFLVKSSCLVDQDWIFKLLGKFIIYISKFFQSQLEVGWFWFKYWNGIVGTIWLFPSFCYFFFSEFMYAHLFMYGCFCGGILLFEDIFRCSAMSAFWNCGKWHFAAKDFGFLFIWAPYKSCVLNLFHFSLNVLFRDWLWELGGTWRSSLIDIFFFIWRFCLKLQSWIFSQRRWSG